MRDPWLTLFAGGMVCLLVVGVVLLVWEAVA